MASRVAVFIDYQNVYKRARECFGHDGDHHIHGQVLPLRLGLVLRDMGIGERDLVAVNVYRGMPSSRHDPKGFGACQRQVSFWSGQALVGAITRPLNYRDRARPVEKGIDVQIAVDFVRGAIEDKFDVGVLFSGDTDLLPALEAVIDLKGPESCEVAAWVPDHGGSPIVLRPKKHQIRIHYLDSACYRQVADSTDYTVQRRRR